MNVNPADTKQQIAQARALFEEYAGWLGIDLSFQGFAAELAGLPGQYARPHGRLLIATKNGETAGCVALRPREPGVCEMKRLFVRSHFRGTGVGMMLAQQIVDEARAIGYAKMRLDTLPSMKPAIRVYELLGFVRCAPYYQTPYSETVFMELDLRKLAACGDDDPF